MRISFGTYLGKKIGADESFARQVDDAIAQDYASVDPKNLR